jgi:tetratricopeptide (TPR) repeat protein
MRKIVIVFFVVCIAAVMSVTAQTAKSYFTAGLEKYEEGLYKEALAEYNKAIELNPQFADAYSNRGMIKSKLGDREGAIADYTKAIELNPKLDAAYFNRGIAKNV